MFKKNGYCTIKEVLSQEEIGSLSEKIKSSFERNEMSFEGNDFHYKNSYGIGQLGSEFFPKITALVENITGYDLEEKNSYGRVYFDGGLLKPHIDRDGLELTLSITLRDTTEHEQVLNLLDRKGKVLSVKSIVGEGVLLMGRELEHWRDEIKSVENGGLYCVFYHWSIKNKKSKKKKSAENRPIDLLNNGLIWEQDGFVIDRVCDRLVSELSGVEWLPSLVYQNGKHEPSDFRTSETVYEYSMSEWATGFLDGLNKIIAEMLSRICLCRFEDWQASKYEVGDLFNYHNDAGIHADNERLYTVILYLNDDFEGGETDFRNKGVRVIPKKGKLVLWRNLDNQNRVNDEMQHSGLQIIEGTKYVLVNFIRLRAIN